jgi:hypothetical protein
MMRSVENVCRQCSGPLQCSQLSLSREFGTGALQVYSTAQLYKLSSNIFKRSFCICRQRPPRQCFRSSADIPKVAKRAAECFSQLMWAMLKSVDDIPIIRGKRVSRRVFSEVSQSPKQYFWIPLLKLEQYGHQNSIHPAEGRKRSFRPLESPEVVFDLSHTPLFGDLLLHSVPSRNSATGGDQYGCEAREKGLVLVEPGGKSYGLGERDRRDRCADDHPQRRGGSELYQFMHARASLPPEHRSVP